MEHGFLQAKIHGQDLVSLQASNSSLSREAEPSAGWTDEEPYAAIIKEHRFIKISFRNLIKSQPNRPNSKLLNHESHLLFKPFN